MTKLSTTTLSATTLRRTAGIAGGLYLVTFISSIPALILLKGTVLGDSRYILGSGSDKTVALACLLDLINAIAAVGTAVVLFPVVRRQNESLAMGFVTSRLFEAAVIVIGIVSLLGVVTLRQDFAAAGLSSGSAPDAATATAIQHSLVAVRDWTFLLGPGVMAGINALLLGTLMYRSGLVPRWIPTLALIGGPLLLASDVAVVFGLWDQTSLPAGIATGPDFVWELALGCYLLFKGFRPAPIIAAPEQEPVLERV